MKKYIIGVDLDGTLLTSNKEIEYAITSNGQSLIT